METVTEFETRLARAIGLGSDRTPTPPGPSGGLVLVVDDELANRRLLAVQFEASDVRTVEAADGIEACNRVGTDHPDAVLLDVMMPGIDGFEVCRRIKSDPTTSHIPVIMISGLKHKEMGYRGMAAGADGFIKKPFDLREIVLRTRNAMRMKQSTDRHRNLKNAYREFVGRTVSGMCAPLERITATMAKVRDGGGLSEELAGEVEASESSARHLVHLSRIMIDINQLESGLMPVILEPLSLRQLASQASELLGSPSHLQNAIPETSEAYCDSHLTARVLSHLIDNAFRHNPDERRAATVTAHIEGENVAVCVSDNGPGIPEEYRERIFEPFGHIPTADGQSSEAASSASIGLAFCKAAIEAQGGEIGVMGLPESGSTFYFTLPSKNPELELAG